MRVAVFTPEIFEAAQRRREGEGFIQTVVFAGEFAEEVDFGEDGGLIGAVAAQGVRLSENRQQVATGRLADAANQAGGIGIIDSVERGLVVADHCAELFAQQEIRAGAPEELTGLNRAALGVSARCDAPVFNPRAGGFGDVVEKCGGEEELAVCSGQGLPFFERGHGFADHVHVDPDVAFGVVDGVLRAVFHGADPVELVVESEPIDGPMRWRRDGARQELHAKRSAPGRRWLGSRGRSIQCSPEASTAWEKLARTYL